MNSANSITFSKDIGNKQKILHFTQKFCFIFLQQILHLWPPDKMELSKVNISSNHQVVIIIISSSNGHHYHPVIKFISIVIVFTATTFPQLCHHHCGHPSLIQVSPFPDIDGRFFSICRVSKRACHVSCRASHCQFSEVYGKVVNTCIQIHDTMT